MQHKADGYILFCIEPYGRCAMTSHERAIHTRPQSRRGSLRATTYRQVKDTRALNALKALRAAPTSMGRGEIPVELCQQPSVFASFYFSYVTERGLLCKKKDCLRAINKQHVKVLWKKQRPTKLKVGRLSYSRYLRKKMQVRLGQSCFVSCKRIVKRIDNFT